MRVAREEIFGPVLCVIPYDDDDDAVRIANDSPYGLSGGVWTADPARALRVARRMRTGSVAINGRYAAVPAGALRRVQGVGPRAASSAPRGCASFLEPRSIGLPPSLRSTAPDMARRGPH